MATKTVCEVMLSFSKCYTAKGQPIVGKAMCAYSTDLKGMGSGRESFAITLSDSLTAAINAEIEAAKGRLVSADFGVVDAAEKAV